MVLLVIRDESSAERRTNAESGEEVSAHHISSALLKILSESDSNLACRQWNKSHEIAEDAVILAQLLEHRLRYGSVVVTGLRGTLRLILIVEIDEAIRIRSR